MGQLEGVWLVPCWFALIIVLIILTNNIFDSWKKLNRMQNKYISMSEQTIKN